MKRDQTPSADAAELRRRAEARLGAGRSEAAALAEVDAQRIVHELQVHKVEPEMQNEELCRSRVEVEAGLERYTELYDFAPVGYMTLGRDGAIRQVNLTGTRLLGVERGRLPGRRFGVLIHLSSRTGPVSTPSWKKYLRARRRRVARWRSLRREKNRSTFTLVEDAQHVRMYGADITVRMQASEKLLKA
jgi:PAS domain-containing protein